MVKVLDAQSPAMLPSLRYAAGVLVCTMRMMAALNPVRFELAGLQAEITQLYSRVDTVFQYARAREGRARRP
jgi:hypothetical protein